MLESPRFIFKVGRARCVQLTFGTGYLNLVHLSVTLPPPPPKLTRTWKYSSECFALFYSSHGDREVLTTFPSFTFDSPPLSIQCVSSLLWDTAPAAARFPPPQKPKKKKSPEFLYHQYTQVSYNRAGSRKRPRHLPSRSTAPGETEARVGLQRTNERTNETRYV